MSCISRSFHSGRRSTVAELDESEFTDQLESRCHGISSRLEGLSGTSIILPGNRIPYMFQEYQGIKSPEPNLPLSTSQQSGNSLTVADGNRERNISDFCSHNRLGRSAATFLTKKQKNIAKSHRCLFSRAKRK